jgi:GT2 family glycosyltransferase
MSRVCIGIPCFQGVSFEVLDDYMRLMFYLGRRTEHEYFLAVKGKSEQFRARNAIVKAALEKGCDYLLMLDDDHIIDTDRGMGPSSRYGFIDKLIKHLEDDPKRGIVGALYYQRGGDTWPVFMYEQDGAPFFAHNSEVSGRMQKVAVTGGGCMMINMKVFDKIDEPWFAPEHEYGTDIQICKQVRAKGFEVWCDTSIVIGHLKLEREIIIPEGGFRAA